MTPKTKAEMLVLQVKMTLMDEDTDCGNEVLCTTIAKKIALLTAQNEIDYWDEVKQEIENLSRRSEQFACGANRAMGEKRCERQCGLCEELYP